MQVRGRVVSKTDTGKYRYTRIKLASTGDKNIMRYFDVVEGDDLPIGAELQIDIKVLPPASTDAVNLVPEA